MKRSRFFSILAAAVVLSLLMIAIPATSALAVTTLTLSASTGPTGTALTITGTEFALSSSGVAWFDTDGDGVRDSGEPYVSVVTSGAGVLYATGTLAVPTVPRAIYYVRADISADGSVEASAPFTVTPDITLSVSTGHVGDTVTVSGTGFYASAGITVLYDGVSKGTTTATASGTFTGFTFIVPGSVKGVHTVRAQETSNPTTYYATDDFTVSPAIAINPTTGSVGDTVTVTGNGFNGSSTITIYFDSVSQTTTSTNSSGTFTATTFAVPSTSRGTHTVKAQDAGSNQATATFTVSTKITINPPSGPSGTTVTVTGTGFGTSSTVTITYNNVTVTTNPPTINTGSTGSFTATFVVPVLAAGTYVVRASAGSDVAMANFQSTTNATISQTTSASSPGYVGMSLTIEGVGFTPNHEITVTYATDPTTIATTNSDGSGNFTVTFTIPPSVAGEHTITVSDGTIIKNFDFYMETTPPPTPALTAPLADTKLKDNTFTWGAVEDVAPASNPISYDLQVAADSSFATPLVDKTGLAATSYTLLDEEKLKSTGKDAPYYWRVRAVDAASNASAWSEASTFTVGFSFAFTGWVVWVTLVVVAIVFFIIGLLVGRRAGGGGYY
jgi:hypothetical protein